MVQPLALINKNRRKTILTGLPKAIFRGGGGAVPYNLVAVPYNQFEHWTILEHFCNKKREYHFKVVAEW